MFRTPDKRTDEAPAAITDATFRVDPSPKKISKVRKSIGDWEAGKTDETEKHACSPIKAATTETEAPVKKTTSLSKMLKTAEQPPPPPPTKYANNLTEAKACLLKIKENLNLARNTKTEIKQDILKAAERLHQLIKEAELKNGKEIKRIEEQPKETEKEPGKDQNRREVDIITKLEEHSKLIRENNAKLEELKVTLNNYKEVAEKTSYAGVVAGGMRKPQPYAQATHSVAITSSDETETGEQVLEKIRKAVNAKDQGLKIDSIRKAKDRKVIVGCSTEGELSRIKDRLRSVDSDLQVVDIKNKDPLVVLKDVLKVHEDKDIIEAIRKQNKDLLTGIKEEDLRMEVRYRKRARNELTCHVVLRVSPKLWGRLTDTEAVHVDLQRVRVADQSPLVQCSKCLGYGHTKRLCAEEEVVCSHCGGPHLRTGCTGWLTGEPPSCRNCHKAKSDRRDHGAFSVDCPVRRRWETLARSSVAYC